MSEQQPPNTPAPNGPMTARQPGAELRLAREAAGQSVEEVARMLHLAVGLVEAIERDDYDRLPESTYVRGYLRSYSRLVGANADDIVAAYERSIGEAAEPMLAPPTATEEPLGGRSPRLAMAVLIAVVLAGVAAWWFVADPVPAPDVAEVPEGNAETAPANDESAVRQEQEQEQEMVSAEAPAADELAELAEVTGAGRDDLPSERLLIEPVETREPVDGSESEATALAEAEAVGDSAADIAAEHEPGETVEEDGVAEPEVVAADIETEPDPVPATGLVDEAVQEAASTGPDRLTVAVNGESWVEIHDQRGRQLVYTLYSGDEPLELRGWAPFDVFLGNSPDVTLAFEGEAVEKGGFTRVDNTARFLVDADGAHPR